LIAGLAADVAGPTRPGGPFERVVFVHGFTQTRHSWQPVATALSDRFETIAVDAPGHGESGGLRLDLPTAAEWLGRTGGPATYVGYSMGGRLALHLALAEPDVVDRLVLVSSTAGIADERARAERRARDEELAAEIERDGVEAFLTWWLALPLFATLPRTAALLDERRSNTPAGLASSLRLAGTGAQQSLWDRLGELTMPVLLIAGALDEKFVAIAEQMQSAIPSSGLDIVAGAGHSVHLERRDDFLAVLTRFLD
jgi:2-succinyl-6-hydroxy-2,4-cyclohexadiene-1-carboxylate synthase